MKHNINKLVVSILFMVYAVCIMIVLITGADIYKTIYNRGTEAYNNRISNQYIVNHVRQSKDISIEMFGDTQALVLHDYNEEYVTKIYYYDGYIMELFTSVNSDMEPLAGKRIAKVNGFKINLENGLLHVDGIEENGLAICVK